MNLLPSHARVRCTDPAYLGIQTKRDLQTALEEYGMPHFVANVVPHLDVEDKTTSRILDEVIHVRVDDVDEEDFTFSKAFNYVLRDIMVDEGCSFSDALNMLASDDFEIPVHVVLYYTLHACDHEVETLQRLIKRRAQSLISLHDECLIAA